MSLIAEQLILWQKKHGRHHLPWQSRKDPYAVWLSEIMLQQTQVSTVVPYYERFITRFPNIKCLARAEVDEVLALWSGLGYYSRARNLHRTACIITQAYQGVFPQTIENINQLPGIGRSTAAAITVFAYGQRNAILDGNVKRVFARYFGIKRYPGESETLKELWLLAEKTLPDNSTSEEIKQYTQALMDLGSMVCIRRKPLCSRCPLHKTCYAFNENCIALLPVRKPKKPLPVKETEFLIYRNLYNKLLLEKRVNEGIWGGMWCFPEFALESAVFPAQQKVQPAELPRLLHTFTHFKLWIKPCLLEVSSVKNNAIKPVIWVKPGDALEMAIPAPVRKLIHAHFMA